jgi:hypothetical protein
MTTIKYTSFKYIAEIVIWCDEALENFGFAIKGASAPKNLQFKDCDTAKSEARKLVKQLKKEALDNNLGAIQGVNITSDYLVTPNEPQDLTTTMTTTITSTERRAMIDSFNYHASLLHQTDEDSPKWDEIWDKMQTLKAQIDNAIVCDEDPNKAIDAEIKRNKERLNKSLLQLAALEEYQELTYDRLLHNINSIAEDIKRLTESRV